VVTGEVIEPAKELAKQESVVKKNWQRAQNAAVEAGRALAVIRFHGYWKLHKNPQGKQAYKSFSDYLENHFGWPLDRTRAYQVMKDATPALVESGELPKEALDNRRNRTAPEVTAAKAAKVTSKQFETARDAYATRIETVEAGQGYRDLTAIWDEFAPHLSTFLSELESFIAASEAESDNADADNGKA
jgi:hypothetical protein